MHYTHDDRTCACDGKCFRHIEVIIALRIPRISWDRRASREPITVTSWKAHAGTAVPGGIGLGYLRRVVSEASRMSGADAITHPLTGVTLQFSCHAVQLFNAEHVNSRHEEKVSYWYTHVSMFKLTVEFHWHLPHASIAEYTTLLQVHSSIPLTRRYQVFGSVSGPMFASPVVQ